MLSDCPQIEDVGVCAKDIADRIRRPAATEVDRTGAYPITCPLLLQ